MYVDDSGTPGVGDDVRYYVISGVIVRSSDLFIVERNVEGFKKKYFVGAYKDEEIHLHDIYHSRGNFQRLTLGEKYSLLYHIYRMIDKLPITVISVGMDKQLLNDYFPSWDIFNTAWTFLVERFDKHIIDQHSSNTGEVIVDRSTNMDENKTKQIINRLIKHGSSFQTIYRIKNEPSFFPSRSQHAIQIADAISYCTLKKLNRCKKFLPYWETVKTKMRKSPYGEIIGYGYKLFPSEILQGYMTESPPSYNL